MITILAGTNRPGSQTLRVAKIIEKRFQKLGAKVEILDLAQLPQEIFHPSSYETKPASFARFSDAVVKSEGLYVITPEYNGGAPGVLKYFIDMLPFPESFEKRPVAFLGLAAGMWGALRPVEQLQSIFGYRNAFIFNERIFLPKISEQIGADEDFTQPLVRTLVDAQVKGFLDFCNNVK